MKIWVQGQKDKDQGLYFCIKKAIVNFHPGGENIICSSKTWGEKTDTTALQDKECQFMSPIYKQDERSLG